MEINFIVAVDINNGIAKGDQIPWYIPEDLKHFKTITTKTEDANKVNAVIMGRKTYESLPNGPLPKRLNVVITRGKEIPNVMTFNSINTAIDHISSFPNLYETIYIIGGEEIYASFPMSRVSYIYLTRIHKDYECTKFFPQIPKYFVTINEKKINLCDFLLYRNTSLGIQIT